MRRRRVDERDERAMRAGPRGLVDQANAPGFQAVERFLDVVHAKREMVEPRPSLFEELRNRRVRSRRLQELERRLACADEMRPHPLRHDVFGRVHREKTQRVAVERKRRLDVRDGDADMVGDGSLPGCDPSCREGGGETQAWVRVPSGIARATMASVAE